MGAPVSFFPDPPEPTAPEEPEDYPHPVWSGPPKDLLAGVVPMELVLGRSSTAVVVLTGVRAYPTGLAMNLGARTRGGPRRELNDEIFDHHRQRDGKDAAWQAGRLKWGFELADGRRVTNLDPSPHMEQPNRDHHRPHHRDDWKWEPDHPVLHGGAGTGGPRSVDREYWLWPLPPAGRLRVACQWLAQSIELSVHDLDAQPFLDAAARAQSIWTD